MLPDAGGLNVEGAFTSIAEMDRQHQNYRFYPIDLVTHQRLYSIIKISHLKIPVLILNGTEYTVAPFKMSPRLYEKAPSPKKFKLTLGGIHNNSARVGGAE